MNQVRHEVSVTFPKIFHVKKKNLDKNSRRNDLSTAFRVEIGRAYVMWFGYKDAVRYLEDHDVATRIVVRVLDLQIYRGWKGEKSNDN